jgi:hypothetical protein
MSNPKWEIGPVELANGTEGHIDFVNDRSKSIAYTGRFKTYNGDWWAIHWNESGRVPNSCEGYGHNLVPPPKKTVRVQRYVNVFEDGCMVSWPTREDADGCKEGSRFACIEIDRIVTEGEGL